MGGNGVSLCFSGWFRGRQSITVPINICQGSIWHMAGSLMTLFCLQFYMVNSGFSWSKVLRQNRHADTTSILSAWQFVLFLLYFFLRHYLVHCCKVKTICPSIWRPENPAAVDSSFISMSPNLPKSSACVKYTLRNFCIFCLFRQYPVLLCQY